jgi:hypothetical protein
MPYKYSKRGALPPARYVDLLVDVNEFQHVSDAENFLAKIALLVAHGHLDIQSGQELSGLVKTWIDTQYAKEELQHKLSPPDTRPQTIRVEGGLPALPGTNVTMPVLNGHAVKEQLLSAPTDVVPPDPPANEFTPGELTPGECKAHGPHPLQPHHFTPDETDPDSTAGGT